VGEPEIYQPYAEAQPLSLIFVHHPLRKGYKLKPANGAVQLLFINFAFAPAD
jgi:hypothetical protein